MTSIFQNSAKKKSKFKEPLFRLFLFSCGLLSIVTTVSIVSILIFECWDFFRVVSLKQFFGDTQWTPLFAQKHFGIWPLFCGTLMATTIAMLVALPIGLISAVYLSEFASSRIRSIVKPTLELLAGIPTVVYGYFALLFVTPLLQNIIPGLSGFNALGPGLIMGIMILPLVTSLSEDAMFAVPSNLREASYALGVNRLRTSFSVIVPAAFSGISASFVLGISRAIGETMIVTIAAGQQPRFTLNPLQPVETMTAYIVQVSLGDTPAGTLEYKTLFAVAFMLFISTFILNLISHHLRQRFREVYE